MKLRQAEARYRKRQIWRAEFVVVNVGSSSSATTRMKRREGGDLDFSQQ